MPCWRRRRTTRPVCCRAVQAADRLGGPPGLEHHPAGLCPLRAHHPRPEGAASRVDPAAFVDPAESDLYARLLQAAEAAPRRAGSVEDFFTAFLPLIPVINRFFEAVLVMAEDPAVRANRLGLLQRSLPWPPVWPISRSWKGFSRIFNPDNG